MKAKSLLYAAVAAIACLSCTREAEGTAQLGEGIELEFTAAWADAKDADSRTALQEDGTSIWWTPNEEINVFSGQVHQVDLFPPIRSRSRWYRFTAH